MASNDDWGQHDTAGGADVYGAGDIGLNNTDNQGAGDVQADAGQDSYGHDGDNYGGDGGNGACFSCGEDGHIKADCPNREARGPGACHQCGQEGHIRADCTAPREIDRSKVADLTSEDAWNKLIQAAAERDIDDAKDALQEYVKSCDGNPTYRQIQEGLMNSDINLWFIALEKEFTGAFVNVDLQGNIGKKYTVSVRFSKTPFRARDRMGWPETDEDILSRLDDAGDMTRSGKGRCYNCDEYGHSAQACPEPEREREEQKLVCSNCTGEHRLRDCKEKRIDKNACKNCGESGHRANECPEPPNPDNMTCRKCEETGHMAKDCPQGGSRACHNCGQEGHMSKECDQPRVMKCRNCDELGHSGRECPKPRDYSRVQCTNCQQFGHTKVRCKEPTADEPNETGGDFGQDASGGQDAAGGYGDGGDAPAAVDSGGW